MISKTLTYNQVFALVMIHDYEHVTPVNHPRTYY